jgi:hypothetical protein
LTKWVSPQAVQVTGSFVSPLSINPAAYRHPAGAVANGGLVRKVEHKESPEVAQAAQVQALEQSVKQQWQEFSRAADDQFETYVRTQLPDGQTDELKKEAQAMLRDYGLTDQEITWQWNNNPSFRSFPAQKMMMDAARWRMSQKSIESKKFRPVPTVQRPGSPTERVPQTDYEIKQLGAKLDRSRGTQAVRAAADLLIAKRQGRR